MARLCCRRRRHSGTAWRRPAAPAAEPGRAAQMAWHGLCSDIPILLAHSELLMGVCRAWTFPLAKRCSGRQAQGQPLLQASRVRHAGCPAHSGATDWSSPPPMAHCPTGQFAMDAWRHAGQCMATCGAKAHTPLMRADQPSAKPDHCQPAYETLWSAGDGCAWAHAGCGDPPLDALARRAGVMPPSLLPPTGPGAMAQSVHHEAAAVPGSWCARSSWAARPARNAPHSARGRWRWKRTLPALLTAFQRPPSAPAALSAHEQAWQSRAYRV